MTVHDVKEFVFVVVFVPMELTLQYPEAYNLIIHPAKGLVVPLILTLGDQPRDIDELEKVVLGVEMDRVSSWLIQKLSLPFTA